MPDSFTVRGYRAGDERAILDLFARSFPHAPQPLDRWQWKYQRNPFGNEHISVSFDADGRLVGHYTGYLVPFVDGRRELLAHQIGDTMTDPSIRHIGRGPTSILGRTALHFYRTFCEQSIAFNYGFNVANIQKFSLRFLRSDRVEPVSYRLRDLRRDPLRAIARWERRLRGYQLELVTAVSPEWDRFFERVRGAYDFLVRRDAAYVRWRYLEHPDTPYTVVAIRKWRVLVGWIVYRIRDDRFIWGDALFDPTFPDAPAVLLGHIVPPRQVAFIEGWFPPRPVWFDRVLHELRFQTRPEPQDLSVMCVPFMQTDAVSRMRESLYYSWGDSDLF